jgi:hypothetical protein
LLTRDRIRALGRAGLYALQISVDNVRPNAVTRKSLRPLLPKLRLLADCATFRVRINTVLGSGPPEEALEVARAAVALGFDTCAVAYAHQASRLDALRPQTGGEHQVAKRCWSTAP